MAASICNLRETCSPESLWPIFSGKDFFPVEHIAVSIEIWFILVEKHLPGSC